MLLFVTSTEFDYQPHCSCLVRRIYHPRRAFLEASISSCVASARAKPAKGVGHVRPITDTFGSPSSLFPNNPMARHNATAADVAADAASGATSSGGDVAAMVEGLDERLLRLT